ncbi:general secretion pathway protein GspK, partial [Candidatus Aerophobetes bacterium]|nr:general secretion pathway protein GspK [Candidatus Aerophobetes bacterium]
MLSSGKTSQQKGQAGIVIIFFVAVVAGIISLSFLYRMRVELEASHNYLNALIAEQLALAGIERTIAELRNDNNHYDDLYEDWAKGFREDFTYGFYDVQLISDEDEVKDVGIVDEASRLNINVAGWGLCNEGTSPFELNLSVIEGLDEKKAKAIVEYRWGDDKMPGKKSVDDDRDAFFISKDGVDN